MDVPIASKLRILAGLHLREIKEFWRAALVLSLLLYPEDIGLSKSLSVEDAELNNRRDLYNRIENAILEMGTFSSLTYFHARVSIITVTCEVVDPAIQQKLLEWQLAHPSGSAEECIDWMRQTQSKRARTE
ncbi:hypothetical protein DH2020_036658 [Rehmannia glutinosa]|uniref:Uncharacterized protein n=1 Tax=Rehmannia glutinosa TaxID=99300 RepID=A0ABR0V4B0_REHGL